MKSTALVLATALACLASAATLGASGDWDAKLICGGIGADERQAMQARAPESNLLLEMFIAQGGEYIADVDVTLKPLGHGSAPLSIRTEGPICLLRVPPGRYHIDATFQGVTRSAEALVPATGTRPVRVALGFPKSVGDQQTDAATPEEKEQAKKP